MKNATEFLYAIKDLKLRNVDRAVLLLWWLGRADHSISKTAKELADELEAAGHARLNPTRFRDDLTKDRRTAKAKPDGFRIRLDRRGELDQEYGYQITTKPVPVSDSVLPRELFNNARDYLKKVVKQVNASYDAGLFDCCAVMCRRILETLVIEVYEHENRADELKAANGHFMMFSGLLAHLQNDTAINLGRNATDGLAGFKKLGDLSAHNRRYNARRDDIDRVRDGLRVACEELLHLCGQA